MSTPQEIIQQKMVIRPGVSTVVKKSTPAQGNGQQTGRAQRETEMRSQHKQKEPWPDSFAQRSVLLCSVRGHWGVGVMGTA